jgi:CS domain
MKKEERMKQLLDITESIDGHSQSMLIPETTPTQKPLPEEEEEEEVVKDEVKAGREQFLKIY